MRARRETTDGFDRAHAESEPPPSASIDTPLAPDSTAALFTDAGTTKASLEVGAGDAPGVTATPFVSATHAALFVSDETVRCDVCSAVVAADADDGYAVTGRGLYVWARGEDVRYEEPHLCAGCAAAVGVSALARWEIEEEEG
jgi:hypothetical protein